MNVYLAAANIRQYEAAKNKKDINVLLSYHYWKSELNKDRIKTIIIPEAKNILIDSGAFSAHNAGIEISLSDYMNFIREVDVKNYAGLDVIFNPEKTFENIQIMKSEGLNPIPTFHMGSEIKYLERLMDFDYIALGGMVKNSNIHDWLMGVFNFIMLNKPTMKVHGFGLTSVSICEVFPWESVDSTSWHNIGRNGFVVLWNEHKNDFYRLFDYEYIKKYNIFGKTVGELEMIGDSHSAKDFQYFEDYLNTKTDFSHLTTQLTLF